MTAQAIASLFDTEVSAIPALNDIDYGYWQGLKVDDVEEKWKGLLEAWHRTPQMMAFPKGESLQSVEARVIDAFHRLLERHIEDTILIVSHDSIIRIILLNALGLPLSRYWLLKITPCSISELTFAEGRYTIHSINQHLHLPAHEINLQ